MKKSKIITIVLFIFFTNFFCLQTAFADDEVLFECDNLKSALSEIIGKDTITIIDLQELEGKLDLSYENITCLDGLEHAVNIEELILSFNNIIDIEPITNLNNLKTLYLDYNWLKELPIDKTNLISLEHLDISNNEIIEIPQAFIDMPALKRLYMGDLKLEIAPELSTLADTLNRLDISSAKLSDFSFVEGLSNLELLIMNDCDMSFLPDLSIMNYLKYLYFANNDISHLPDYLGNMPLLRLDFSGNLVSKMPDTFMNLTNLEQLVFTDNYFTHLPDVVTHMRDLEVLMCSQNIIEDVPDNISSLENVKRASFASNNLTSLEKFLGFNIPYSYQISFDMNYLDLNDEYSIEVLEDYRNDGGTQRQEKLTAQVIKSDTNSLEIKCDLAISGDNNNLSSIKLFKIENDSLYLVSETVLLGKDLPELIITLLNPAVGVEDYLVCLEEIEGSWPPKTIKYTAYLQSVQVESTPTPSPTQEVAIQTPTATATPIQEIVEQKGISTKLLLYILLLGVIIIISAFIIHILFYRRK